MKKLTLISAFPLLKAAKLTQMDDSDKWLVILATRRMKAVAAEWEETVKEVQEKLKGDSHDEIVQKQQALLKAYPTGQISSPTDEERADLAEVNAYFADYNNRIGELLKKEQESETEADYQRIGEEAFKKLMASNPDLSVENILTLQEALL